MSKFKIGDYVCDNQGQEWRIVGFLNNDLTRVLKWDDVGFGYDIGCYHVNDIVLRDVYKSDLYKAMSENESPQMEEK